MLSGGTHPQLRRTGNHIIRPCDVWSPFVHELLRFLTANGFQESPVLLASSASTETLSFIEGQVGHEPLDAALRSDAVLIEAAQLLRKFHDLTQQFVVPPGARFMLPLPANQPPEVICHNDFAPYNCVFEDGHLIGIIDFDTAAPGSRLWDIAYAVYRFVPLASDAHCLNAGWQSPPDRSARLRQFCAAYGLEDHSRLIATVIQRIQALVQFMRDTGSNLAHIPIYLEALAYIESNRPSFEQALL